MLLPSYTVQTTSVSFTLLEINLQPPSPVTSKLLHPQYPTNTMWETISSEHHMGMCDTKVIKGLWAVTALFWRTGMALGGENQEKSWGTTFPAIFNCICILSVLLQTIGHALYWLFSVPHLYCSLAQTWQKPCNLNHHLQKHTGLHSTAWC